MLLPRVVPSGLQRDPVRVRDRLRSARVRFGVRVTPAEVAIALQALQAVASAAPGLLALLSSEASDAEAIDRARKALASVRRAPARAGIDRRQLDLIKVERTPIDPGSLRFAEPDEDGEPTRPLPVERDRPR